MAKTIKKKWFEIKAPKIFDYKEIGETLALESKEIMGRTVNLNASSMIGDPRKQHIKLILKVGKIKDEIGYTFVKKLEIMRSYIGRIVRKKASKITAITSTKTKDGLDIKIRITAITTHKAHFNQQKEIRKILETQTAKMAIKYNYSALILTIISEKLQATLRNQLKKIYPIKQLEVEKVELLTEKFIEE